MAILIYREGRANLWSVVGTATTVPLKVSCISFIFLVYLQLLPRGL